MMCVLRVQATIQKLPADAGFSERGELGLHLVTEEIGF